MTAQVTPNKDREPLVSILINNHNYASFLGQAVESALSQTYRNVEVVVVDDGSTDDSRSVIAGFGKQIVPVLKENGGQASAYNHGFAASTGRIICLLDSDDLFLPVKVERVVEIFQENQDIGWCFDKVRKFEDSTGVRLQPPDSGLNGRWDVRAMMAKGKPPYVPTASSGLSFPRHMLDNILPMPEMIQMATGSAHDAYLKWIAMALSAGWIVQEDLTLQRIHGNNAYTKRSEAKVRLGAQWKLSTGVCLSQQCPPLQRLANNVFSRGLGESWVTGGIDPKFTHPVQSYLRALAFSAKTEVILRALYWGTRQRLGIQ